MYNFSRLSASHFNLRKVHLDNEIYLRVDNLGLKFPNRVTSLPLSNHQDKVTIQCASGHHIVGKPFAKRSHPFSFREEGGGQHDAGS